MLGTVSAIMAPPVEMISTEPLKTHTISLSLHWNLITFKIYKHFSKNYSQIILFYCLDVQVLPKQKRNSGLDIFNTLFKR